VTRHFDLVQNTASVVGAITKLSPNTIAHAPVQIDLDNVPVVERKYESSKKDKKADKEKAEKAAVKEAAGAAVESDLGLAKGSIAEADAEKKEGRAGKKEKKAKAAAAEGAAGEGKAAGKKEKGSGGGGKGGAAPAEPEVITPGLIDLRVGRIVEGGSAFSACLIQAPYLCSSPYHGYRSQEAPGRGLPVCGAD
jgi:hypothetical protein